LGWLAAGAVVVGAAVAGAAPLWAHAPHTKHNDIAVAQPAPVHLGFDANANIPRAKLL
jgi:hypothetical protein